MQYAKVQRFFDIVIIWIPQVVPQCKKRQLLTFFADISGCEYKIKILSLCYFSTWNKYKGLITIINNITKIKKNTEKEKKGWKREGGAGSALSCQQAPVKKIRRRRSFFFFLFNFRHVLITLQTQFSCGCSELSQFYFWVSKCFLF